MQHWECFDHFYPYVIKDDKVFKAGKQSDLFIMLKLDRKTPNTDDGWVYGTVTPDAKTVTSAGKVASCMKCHVEAKADRLFGLAVVHQCSRHAPRDDVLSRSERTTLKNPRGAETKLT